MTIDYIVVAGFKHDVQFTRTCVASIRHWYPHIPIYFLKDEFYGPYDTTELERRFGVKLFPTDRKRFNWGMGKLEPLFGGPGKRFLVLDSDIVLVGPILEQLNQHNDDFVVQWEDPTPEFVASNAFDVEGLKQMDPSFDFPGFTFNTGQWVGTTGIFNRKDFEHLIEWSEPPKVLHPSIFKLGEQGLLNYFLQKQSAAGRCTLRRLRFMEVPNEALVAGIKIDRLAAKQGYPFLIHWCGLRRPRFEEMYRGDILAYFESLYYQKLAFGQLVKKCRNTYRDALRSARSFYRRLRPSGQKAISDSRIS
jgi:hypothetical protein